MHYMAKSILYKDEDVADALQETILKAYKALPSLREPKFFKTWMFRILINECHNIIAHRSGAVVYAELPPIATRPDDYEKVDLREAVDRLDEPFTLGNGRSTDINDIIANTLGGVLGFLIYKKLTHLKVVRSLTDRFQLG